MPDKKCVYLGKFYEEDWEWDGKDERLVRRERHAISFDNEALQNTINTYRSSGTMVEFCHDEEAPVSEFWELDF